MHNFQALVNWCNLSICTCGRPVIYDLVCDAADIRYIGMAWRAERVEYLRLVTKSLDHRKFKGMETYWKNFRGKDSLWDSSHGGSVQGDKYYWLTIDREL